MTMFTAENRQLCGGGNYGISGGVGSDLLEAMAEDDELRNEESRSSKDEEGWLQLSIGPGQTPRRSNVELELMPSNSRHSGPEIRPPRPVTNFPGYGYGIGSSSSNIFHQEINWAFRPMIPISSSSSLIGSGPFFQIDGPSVDFRVIQPPRRPHSGIWFMLQASQNQEKEPLLPQISKSYLRIKDGKMTIRLVIKYLVSKLSLENESEIEIRCKGQRLLPFLTLQHVRDNIWSSPRDFITLLPNSSTTHHIMVLHYARTTSSSSN
ncbi:hypothetical protein ACS0TY_010787 [Phlomoides rotata]